jgi:signal transduction histidine kinase
MVNGSGWLAFASGHKFIDRKTEVWTVTDRRRVLVVDSDRSILNVLEMLLEGEGYDIRLVTSGKAAMDEWCNADTPPIVLLDWVLPDMEGTDICRRIRQHPQGKYAYIMFLSSKGLREYRIAGVTAGADDFLVKPVHAEELKTRLRSGVRILELQYQLIERNKMLEEFVYSVTHDMRTPLIAMDMTANQALEGVYGPISESYTKILVKTRRSIGDLLNMAENLLRIARYETGQLDAADERSELVAVANEVMSELEPIYQQKSIKLELESNVKGVSVKINRHDLKRIVQNLLDNAIKYTPPQGNVKLRVELAANKVIVGIMDTGLGLPKDEAKKVFERFTRAKGSRHLPGTGLGLYLCRKIIESHGGIVDCIPRPDGGTTFSFLLPVESGN